MGPVTFSPVRTSQMQGGTTTTINSNTNGSFRNPNSTVTKRRRYVIKS